MGLNYRNDEIWWVVDAEQGFLFFFSLFFFFLGCFSWGLAVDCITLRESQVEKSLVNRSGWNEVLACLTAYKVRR